MARSRHAGRQEELIPRDDGMKEEDDPTGWVVDGEKTPRWAAGGIDPPQRWNESGQVRPVATLAV
jgi:hypothetical protein